MCKYLGVSRSSYYRWLKGELSNNECENTELLQDIRKIHSKYPEMGYRRIRDKLARDYHKPVNDKRVLRLCRKANIRSQIKYACHGCTRPDRNPVHIAENVLNREFKTNAPNKKWVTDITEFAWHEGPKVYKFYLSAILDLYDNRIVAYKIGTRNDLKPVLDTLNTATAAFPEATPILHSDRGFQYTNDSFHCKLVEQGITQSMSRVAHCLDNAPMEGFWGLMKREMYYKKKFKNPADLLEKIDDYIDYYNRRYQRKLKIMAPMEYYLDYYNSAA